MVGTWITTTHRGCCWEIFSPIMVIGMAHSCSPRTEPT